MSFLDPELWAEQYFMEESRKYAAQQFLEDEMRRHKTEAVKRFYVLTHPNYAEQLAVTIAFGYNNSLPEAEKIVDKLHLEDKHIAALLEDVQMMDKIIFQEKLEEKMMNEIMFNNSQDEIYDEHCYC